MASFVEGVLLIGFFETGKNSKSNLKHRPKFFPHIVDDPRKVQKGGSDVELKASILEG